MNIFPLKRCRGCGAIRPLAKFYRHRDGGDGTLNKCIMCCRAAARDNYHQNAERYRAYQRGYKAQFGRN